MPTKLIYMLFTQIEFSIFLTIVFLLYWFVFNKSIRQSNIFLLLVSYIFYAYWNWRFLFLLLLISCCSWLFGYLIERQHDTNHIGGGKNQELFIAINTIVDILVLCTFKYYDFFIESFQSIIDHQYNLSTLNLILPLGISFYIFQSIAYPIDIYRGKFLARQTNNNNFDSFINCLLYIGFFPKIVAGPIEKPSHFIPQLQVKRTFSSTQFSQGLRQILWGLFKKLVVADNCAVYVNYVWSNLSSQNGSTLLIASILYTIQIYGDFSGYSDMAIGTAKLLGFNFKDNFLFPYFSRNMGEFWKRWHISLNTWFVEYVYIPLGGSKNGKARTIANTMIIFLLSGLWHGADWTFVCWGGYHGIILVLLILFGINTKYNSVVAYNNPLPTIKELLQILTTFVIASFGWILFRAGNFTEFYEFVNNMFSTSLFSAPYLINRNYYIPLFIYILIMLITDWFYRKDSNSILSMPTKFRWLRWLIYYVLVIAVIYCGPQESVQFIYQQF